MDVENVQINPEVMKTWNVSAEFQYRLIFLATIKLRNTKFD